MKDDYLSRGMIAFFAISLVVLLSLVVMQDKQLDRYKRQIENMAFGETVTTPGEAMSKTLYAYDLRICIILDEYYQEHPEAQYDPYLSVDNEEYDDLDRLGYIVKNMTNDNKVAHNDYVSHGDLVPVCNYGY